MSYCAEPHRDGWLCVLAEGHDGPHLSIDNRALWRGTPGRPVWWLDGVDTEPLSPFQAASAGFTGDLCDHCGGARVLRTASCTTCVDCGTTTGCS